MHGVRYYIGSEFLTFSLCTISCQTQHVDIILLCGGRFWISRCMPDVRCSLWILYYTMMIVSDFLAAHCSMSDVRCQIQLVDIIFLILSYTVSGSLREWELLTYDRQKWHWANCLPYLVFYICLSVRRFVDRRQNWPKMRTLFCIVHIKKTFICILSCVLICFLNASRHLFSNFFGTIANQLVDIILYRGWLF